MGAAGSTLVSCSFAGGMPTVPVENTAPEMLEVLQQGVPYLVLLSWLRYSSRRQ